MEGKTIFRGASRLSGTGIVECLEIIDAGCNLKQFDGLSWLTPTLHILRQIYVSAQLHNVLFVCLCVWVSVYVLTVQQTQFHSTASVAPADLRLRVAADNALDQPIGVDAQILRTGRAVECYVLWNTQNHPSNKYYAAEQDCLRCDSKVLFLPSITPRRNVNFKGRARTPITRVGGY